MCRLLAYAGPPIPLETVLIRPAASLIRQARAAREAKTVVNADGCGVGWYGSRPEPGVYRNILPAWSDANLQSLCRAIESRLFIAHVRSATSGEVSHANCHPFAAGPHLFAHNGQIGAYEAIRRQVEALIPDAVYQLRRGASDSEALFLAAMGRGRADDPAAALAATLADVLGLLRAAGADPSIRVAAVIADGRRLHAVRWASDAHPPSLYWRRCGEGVVVASEPYEACGPDWNAVAPDTVVSIEPDGALSVRAFMAPVAAAA